MFDNYFRWLNRVKSQPGGPMTPTEKTTYEALRRTGKVLNAVQLAYKETVSAYEEAQAEWRREVDERRARERKATK